MTIDADLLPADQGLRTTYFGTHNYGMGVAFCEWLKKLQPNGGKVALMFGNPAAENLNERGYGFRDCIKGEVLTAPTTKSRDPLAGEGGWTEVAPTFTNDDIATANQQFADVLAANPDLKAYVLLGGWAQQGCEAFNATGKQYEDRFKSGDLVVVAGDTVGCQLDTVRAGFSQVNVGQRPYQMGREAPDYPDQDHQGRARRQPGLYRPRRVHEGERRQLRQRLAARNTTIRKGPCGAPSASEGLPRAIRRQRS